MVPRRLTYRPPPSFGTPFRTRMPFRRTAMPTIDADAHVVETEHTWDYMDPADARYRPALVSPRGESGRQYWLVDGKIRGLARQVITAQQFAALSERAGRRMDTPQETREMENIEAR